MGMSETALRAKLSCEEPVYRDLAASVTEEDLPALRALARGEEEGVATKAIYLASLLEPESAHEIVLEAANSRSELRRIAAGSGMVNLPPEKAERIALRLLDEKNPALKKLVLRGIRAPSPGLAAKIRSMGAAPDLPEQLRAMARAKMEGR